MAIEFKNVKFKYQQEAPFVIDDVSFTIPKGSYTSIIGHNGSGKSTLAKLMVGLMIPNQGEITVDQITLSEETLIEVRKNIAIVFQNPDNQFIGATVADDIAFGLENRQVDPKDMDSIIEAYAREVNMLDFLGQEPTKLSGGQKQRVALAGALAMRPSILILDEATAMLDPKGKKEIMDFVDRLHSQYNMTIISITHDIESLSRSDQIIVMNKGKKVFDGKPVDLLVNETLLLENKLDLPYSVQLAKNLPFNLVNPLNEKELLDQICQLNSNK